MKNTIRDSFLSLSSLKRVSKKLICYTCLYLGFVHFYLIFIKLFQKNFPAIILTYHRFAERYDGQINTNPSFTHLISDFRKEIDFLQNNFDVVSLDTIVANINKGIGFKRPTVAIAIDDGYVDNFDFLFPVLKERKIPATIFITTSYISTVKRMWFDRMEEALQNTNHRTINLKGMLELQELSIDNLPKRRRLAKLLIERMKELSVSMRDELIMSLEKQLEAPLEEKPLMLNWQQVLLMYNDGICFGAHTCTHPILTKISLEEAKNEIVKSKIELEQRLGSQVKHFAFPNGRKHDFSEDLRNYCKTIGFESICSYENDGGNRDMENTFNLKRLSVSAPFPVFIFDLVRRIK